MKMPDGTHRASDFDWGDVLYILLGLWIVFPWVAAVADLVGMFLLGHGFTGIDWALWRIIFAILWPVAWVGIICEFNL